MGKELSDGAAVAIRILILGGASAAKLDAVKRSAVTEKTINRICRARLFVKLLAISPLPLLSLRLHLVNTVVTQAYTNSYLSVSSQRSDPVCTAVSAAWYRQFSGARNLARGGEELYLLDFSHCLDPDDGSARG